MSHPVIVIVDTTLRDSAQAPGVSLRASDRLEIARQLDRLGVDGIDVGVPVSASMDLDTVQRIGREIRRPAIVATARCEPAALEMAAWAIRPARRRRIHVTMSTSDIHLTGKLRLNRSQCLEAAVDAVRFARRYTDEVQFSAEDATRSDLEFLCRVVEAVIQAGATTINLPDSVGHATPDDVRELFTAVRNRVCDADRVVFSTQCRNDLGLAVANSLAAIGAGARQVECAVTGIGGQGGNTTLEQVVLAMTVRADRLPYSLGVDATQLHATSALVARLTGQPVQGHTMFMGWSAFAQEGERVGVVAQPVRPAPVARAQDPVDPFAVPRLPDLLEEGYGHGV